MIRAARIALAPASPVVADLKVAICPGFTRLLGLVNHLILSEDFACELSGAKNAAAAARALWCQNREVVIVTRGVNGLRLPGLRRHSPKRVPAFKSRPSHHRLRRCLPRRLRPGRSPQFTFAGGIRSLRSPRRVKPRSADDQDLMPTPESVRQLVGIIQAMNPLTLKLEEALAEVPMLDPHTHLVGGKLGARGLPMFCFITMVVTDLLRPPAVRGKRA